MKNINISKWNNKLELIEEFINTNWHLPSQYAKDQKELSLCNWMNYNKIKYKNGSLTKEQEEKVKLVSLLYSFFNVSIDIRWNETFSKLENFINTKGSMPSQYAKDPKEHSLWSWKNYNKIKYKKGYLTKEQEKKIKSVDLLYAFFKY